MHLVDRSITPDYDKFHRKRLIKRHKVVISQTGVCMYVCICNKYVRLRGRPYIHTCRSYDHTPPELDRHASDRSPEASHYNKQTVADTSTPCLSARVDNNIGDTTASFMMDTLPTGSIYK